MVVNVDSPRVVPEGPKYPPGTDLELARAKAPALARYIDLNKYSSDKKIIAAWQTAAGIKADGIYGRGTFAALRYFYPAAPRFLYAQGEEVYPWAT